MTLFLQRHFIGRRGQPKKKKIIRDLCELDKEYNDPRIPNARAHARPWFKESKQLFMYNKINKKKSSVGRNEACW